MEKTVENFAACFDIFGDFIIILTFIIQKGDKGTK